ncbi:MAG: SLC13 family permease [Gemmatimonadota bacterium]
MQVHPLKPAAARASAVAALLCLTLGLAAPLAGVPAATQRAVGVALFAAIAWTGRPVPVELSSLAILVILPPAGLLTLRQALAAFSGPAVWLVYAGMILSQMLLELELGEAAARRLVCHLSGTTFRLLLALHALGLGAAFLVPSGVVRVLLLLPVAEAVSRQLEREGRGQARTAVYLSLICSTYFGGCGVLTGSVPNLVVAGQLEAATGRTIYWSQWLVWMLPVVGVARTALSLGVIWVLHGRHLPRRETAPAPPADPVAGHPGRGRGMAILILGMVLWATDALHHLAPVYVGLVLVLLCVAPGVGPLPPSRLGRVDFAFFLYLAALFAVGDALQAAGLGERLVAPAAEWLSLAERSWWARHLAITALVVPLDFLMDIAAVAGVVTPVLVPVAQAQGVGDLAAAMSVAMATCLVFLPYQSAPFMVALQRGRLRFRDLAGTMALISSLSLVVLYPLNVAYWRWVGLI